MTAPITTGWNESCRVGFAPTERRRLFTAHAEAWDLIQQFHADIDVILLDRMMPNMDGLQVMKNIKSHPEIRYIPVVMQTAAAAKEQVIQGINAGVYYYLTKPYDEDTLLSIVSAAIGDYREHKKLRDGLFTLKQKPHLLVESWFKIATLDDARYLATFLANFFPNPEQVILGISELLINAIEHGNLGITYDEKSKLLYDQTLEQEIENRLNLAENRNKYAHVHYLQEEEEITLHIKDQGKGLDWQKYIEIAPPDFVGYFH